MATIHLLRRPKGMSSVTPADAIRPIMAVALLGGGVWFSARGAGATVDSVSQAFFLMSASVLLAAGLAAVVWALDFEAGKRRDFGRLRYAYFLEKGLNKASLALDRFMSIGVTDRHGGFAQIHIPLFRMATKSMRAYYTDPLVHPNVVRELAVHLFTFEHLNKMADVAETAVLGAVQSDSPGTRHIIAATQNSLQGLLASVAQMLEVDVPHPADVPHPPTPG